MPPRSRSKKNKSRKSRRSPRKIRVRGGVYAPLTTALAGSAAAAAFADKGGTLEEAKQGALMGYVGGSTLQDLDRTIKGQKIVYTDKEGNEVQESKLLSYAPDVIAALGGIHGARKEGGSVDNARDDALRAYALSGAARDAYRWYKGAEVRDKGPKSLSPPAANVEEEVVEEEAVAPHHHALTPHHPLTPRASRRRTPRRSKRRSGSRK